MFIKNHIIFSCTIRAFLYVSLIMSKYTYNEKTLHYKIESFFLTICYWLKNLSTFMLVTKNFLFLLRLWCSTTSHEIRSGAFAFSLYGSWKRWFRNVKITRHQRFRTRWREIFPRKVGKHWIPGLSCTWSAVTVLLLGSDRSSVLFLFGFWFRWLQFLKEL